MLHFFQEPGNVVMGEADEGFPAGIVLAAFGDGDVDTGIVFDDVSNHVASFHESHVIEIDEEIDGMYQLEVAKIGEKIGLHDTDLHEGPPHPGFYVRYITGEAKKFPGGSGFRHNCSTAEYIDKKSGEALHRGEYFAGQTSGWGNSRGRVRQGCLQEVFHAF